MHKRINHAAPDGTLLARSPFNTPSIVADLTSRDLPVQNLGGGLNEPMLPPAMPVLHDVDVPLPYHDPDFVDGHARRKGVDTTDTVLLASILLVVVGVFILGMVKCVRTRGKGRRGKGGMDVERGSPE